MVGGKVVGLTYRADGTTRFTSGPATTATGRRRRRCAGTRTLKSAIVFGGSAVMCTGRRIA